MRTTNSIDAPDFYWQFRLDRLSSKMGATLPFKATNYPDVTGNKDLYDAYYLDLTLQGKLNGFDWETEKKITDSEWMTIYKNISKWSKDTAKKNKPDMTNVPENDFDLLKQFYPQLNYRDLETPFSEEEVGPNFPYRSMKDMMSAAVNGKLSVPGYESVTSIDASETKKALAKLEADAMTKIDAIKDKTMAFATAAYPDADAKTHYKKLKSTLGDFPQTAADWSTYKMKMDKEIDEMATLASKRDEHHGHHEEEEGEHAHAPHVSPSEEFQAKYGRSLEEMQERMSKFKSDPTAFLENSIIEKYGKNGLDVWKKSQEFSEKMSTMSAADVAAAQKQFTDFLDKA